jgi:CheY-like chemotaxis protein
MYLTSDTRGSGKRQNTILTIDDERTGLLTRGLVLESVGYQVLMAGTGEEGLKLFRMHPVDLVLLDYFLPDMGGAAVSKMMKSLKPEIPIVVFSGVNEMPKDLQHVDLFMSKLVGPEELLHRVANLLQEPAGRKAA